MGFKICVSKSENKKGNNYLTLGLFTWTVGLNIGCNWVSALFCSYIYVGWDRLWCVFWKLGVWPCVHLVSGRCYSH